MARGSGGFGGLVGCACCSALYTAHISSSNKVWLTCCDQTLQTVAMDGCILQDWGMGSCSVVVRFLACNLSWLVLAGLSCSSAAFTAALSEEGEWAHGLSVKGGALWVRNRVFTHASHSLMHTFTDAHTTCNMCLGRPDVYLPRSHWLIEQAQRHGASHERAQMATCPEQCSLNGRREREGEREGGRECWRSSGVYSRGYTK